jgi:hypothetical protein
MKGALKLVAVTTLLALLAPAPASACTVADLSPAQRERDADLILTGTVVRATRPSFLSSTAENVSWTFAVDEVEKGRRRNRIVVASPLGGPSCGYEFQVGHRYRVLADRQDGTTFHTGLGSGNDELPLLSERPPIEGDYYRLDIAVPAPVLYAVPVVMLLVIGVVLAVLVRRLAGRLRASPD